MVDRVRYTSVPPGNIPDRASTMVNPSYSSTIISTSETGSIATNPTCERVDIEMVPLTKRIMSGPKKIKMFILYLIGMVGILLLLNSIFILLWITSSSTPMKTTPHVLISENETSVETETPLYTTDMSLTAEESTPLEPSTTPNPLSIVSNETLNLEYSFFTRRFNRSKSEDKLQNFAVNHAIFTTKTARMTMTETQFADLSLNDLKKLLNRERDSKRFEDRFHCKEIRNLSRSYTMSIAMDLHNSSRIPARNDLRRFKPMPNVRNQGTVCNSGYAHASIGELDFAFDKSFSLQYLLCDRHNLHCEGGEVFEARQTAATIGIPEDNELPLSEDMKWCDETYNLTKKIFSPCFVSAFSYNHSRLTEVHQVTTEDMISVILSRWLPTIVEVPVDRSFFFYKSGYYMPNCSEIIGYQPVLVVGYDKKDGVEYWILRNSFGTEWGIDGDFEMVKGVKMDNVECDAFAYAIY